MIMRGLAAKSLSMGKITDCQRILYGYWSQFLLQHVSADAVQVAELPADAPSSGPAFPPPQPKSEEAKPSDARQSQAEPAHQSLPLPLAMTPYPGGH